MKYFTNNYLMFLHSIEMAEQCGGFDFEFKDKKSLYECPICKNIINQCTELPCHHTTCKSCLEKWERQKFEMFHQIGER